MFVCAIKTAIHRTQKELFFMNWFVGHLEHNLILSVGTCQLIIEQSVI